MYTITKQNKDGYDFHGLIDTTGQEVIPHIHKDPREAIAEVIYLLKMNQKQIGNRKFLAVDPSTEEIEEIERELLEQVSGIYP